MKTLKQFEIWLDKARKDEDEQLSFVWEIMRSPFVEYHFSLLKDASLNTGFRQDLSSRFDEHHEAGQAFLLSKLDSNEDSDFHADIIFLLGKLNSKRDMHGRDKAVNYARKLAISSDARTRDRAIIVLGWIGTMDDIPLLADRLINDPNDKCRAWAATSFMQMWFGRKSAKLVEKVLPHLCRSIRREQDYFALGCMIDVVQQLTQKRFGLAQKNIDNIDKAKINEAKLKVERYFKKLYNE